MRARFAVALAFAALALSGCAGVSRPSGTVWYEKEFGRGYGDFVMLAKTAVDDRTIEIVAYGSGGLTARQVCDVWATLADQVAAGRPYEKRLTVEAWRHEGMSVNYLPGAPEVGTKVTGRMVLQADTRPPA